MKIAEGTNKRLEEVGLALAEVALPSLALRVSSALTQSKEEVEEVWKAIREDSEELFAPALEQVARVKVIYVASKFANNKMIGELMTGLAMDQARSKRED